MYVLYVLSSISVSKHHLLEYNHQKDQQRELDKCEKVTLRCMYWRPFYFAMIWYIFKKKQSQYYHNILNLISAEVITGILTGCSLLLSSFVLSFSLFHLCQEQATRYFCLSPSRLLLSVSWSIITFLLLCYSTCPFCIPDVNNRAGCWTFVNHN